MLLLHNAWDSAPHSKCVHGIEHQSAVVAYLKVTGAAWGRRPGPAAAVAAGRLDTASPAGRAESCRMVLGHCCAACWLVACPAGWLERLGETPRVTRLQTRRPRRLHPLAQVH